MSSFDAERGVMVLEPEQWDVLQRMVTGPVAQRANYAQGVLAGLEDIGVIDPYGPTLAASEVLAGLMAADARYSLRRMDPKDSVPVRDIVFWLSSPRCTVERYDSDGVHVYGCDDVEDGLAGGGPWVAASPYESFFRDRKAGLCEVVPLVGCEGGGGASVALDILGGEFGPDLVDSVEGSQPGELDERDLASC